MVVFLDPINSHLSRIKDQSWNIPLLNVDSLLKDLMSVRQRKINFANYIYLAKKCWTTSNSQKQPNLYHILFTNGLRYADVTSCTADQTCCFILCRLYCFCAFSFGVWSRMRNSIVSLPEHCVQRAVANRNTVSKPSDPNACPMRQSK